MELLLVRHGQSTGNIVDYDVPDGPLTELGRLQAAVVARRLAGFGLTHIYSSPLLRALETASAIAAACALPVQVLKETYEVRSLGPFNGPPLAELARRFPLARFEASMEPEGWHCPGGENRTLGDARARRVLERLRTSLPADANVALVAHGGFNQAALRVLLSVENIGAITFAQANTCLNHIRLEGENVSVRSLNDAVHLAEVEERSA